MHHLYAYYFSKTQIDFTKTTREKVLDIQLFTNRYLTSWNMAVQALYFIVALIHEILSINKNKITQSLLDRIRGFIFSALVLPCTAVVAFFFWTIYFVNPNLVIPEGIEEISPYWMNHVIHTNILFLPIIELSLQKLYVPSTRTALIGVTVFAAIYNVMFLLSYFETEKWMYDLYEYLSWPQRLVLMGSKILLGVAVCQLGLSAQNMKAKTSDINNTKHNKKRVANVTKKSL